MTTRSARTALTVGGLLLGGALTWHLVGAQAARGLVAGVEAQIAPVRERHKHLYSSDGTLSSALPWEHAAAFESTVAQQRQGVAAAILELRRSRASIPFWIVGRVASKAAALEDEMRRYDDWSIHARAAREATSDLHRRSEEAAAAAHSTSKEILDSDWTAVDESAFGVWLERLASITNTVRGVRLQATRALQARSALARTTEAVRHALIRGMVQDAETDERGLAAAARSVTAGQETVHEAKAAMRQRLGEGSGVAAVAVALIDQFGPGIRVARSQVQPIREVLTRLETPIGGEAFAAVSGGAQTPLSLMVQVDPTAATTVTVVRRVCEVVERIGAETERADASLRPFDAAAKGFAQSGSMADMRGIYAATEGVISYCATTAATVEELMAAIGHARSELERVRRIGRQVAPGLRQVVDDAADTLQQAITLVGAPIADGRRLLGQCTSEAIALSQMDGEYASRLRRLKVANDPALQVPVAERSVNPAASRTCPGREDQVWSRARDGYPPTGRLELRGLYCDAKFGSSGMGTMYFYSDQGEAWELGPVAECELRVNAGQHVTMLWTAKGLEQISADDGSVLYRWSDCN